MNSILFFLIIILLAACGHGRKLGKIEIISKSLKVPVSFARKEDLTIVRKDLRIIVKREIFESSLEAKKYAMERRMLILRKFETLVEPYFGTANAKKCTENLRSDYIFNEGGHFLALLRVPTKGHLGTIHDCLLESNTDWGHIELLVCGKIFYDVRLFVPLSREPLDYKAHFQCAEAS